MKTPSFNLRLELSVSSNLLRLNRWLRQRGATLPMCRGRYAKIAGSRQALRNPRVRRALAGQVTA